MNRIIVTGGAGFIGSAVARHIINDTPDCVCVVDKLTYAGNLENLSPIAKSDRFKFEKVDICDKDELDRVFSEFKPTHVMHLAAESHVDRSIDGPGEFIQTNIVGTYTLLEAARKYYHTLDDAGKAVFKFHHISTDEVYGDLNGPEVFFRETTPYIACLQEIAYENGWMTKDDIRKSVQDMLKTEYGHYLLRLIED